MYTAQYHGGIAQLGEHLLCKQGVSGSIPLISTKVVTRNIVLRDLLTGEAACLVIPVLYPSLVTGN